MAQSPFCGGKVSPSGTLNSKLCIRCVKNRNNSCLASCSPKQLLLPVLKEKNILTWSDNSVIFKLLAKKLRNGDVSRKLYINKRRCNPKFIAAVHIISCIQTHVWCENYLNWYTMSNSEQLFLTTYLHWMEWNCRVSQILHLNQEIFLVSVFQARERYQDHVV